MNFSILIGLGILSVLLCNSAYALTEEQVKHEKQLSSLALERCATEMVEGRDYSMEANASGYLEVSFFGKKGGGGDGKFIYTEKEWAVQQRVIAKHVHIGQKYRQDCILSELKSLRSRYQPPSTIESRKLEIRWSSREISIPSKVYEIGFNTFKDFTKKNNFGCVGRVEVDAVGAFIASSKNAHESTEFKAGKRITESGVSDGSTGNCSMIVYSDDSFIRIK